MIEQDGAGLKTLVFHSDDLAGDRAALERRGLRADEIVANESVDPASGRVRYWSRMRLDNSTTHGVRIFCLTRRAPDPLAYKAQKPDIVSGLDHVVINTANPDRAVALYGARLGLRLALDRSNPDWDMRLMFFRVGGMTVELAHKISTGVGNQPDKLWGLSWKVPDLEAAYARLVKEGFGVTAIRAGRRAGTRVFSVRDGTLGIPTLVIAEAG
jgi:catechol 2,3-dioxygenase-like lactoylglutathione lyase family enzyme